MADATINTLTYLIENIKPGKPCDELARETEKLGVGGPDIYYQGYFGYSVGMGYQPTWTEAPLYIVAGSDRVLEPGTDLLARVDDILLRTGAPAGHSVWSSLSKVGALPSAAVAAVAALSPTDIRAIAEHLTEVGDGLRDLPDTVPPRLESRGLDRKSVV